jgi:hypothetical protein
MQKILKTAWETGFSPDDCIELIVKGAEQAERQTIFNDLESGELELGKAGIVDYVRKQGLRKSVTFLDISKQLCSYTYSRGAQPSAPVQWVSLAASTS